MSRAADEPTDMKSPARPFRLLAARCAACAGLAFAAAAQAGDAGPTAPAALDASTAYRQVDLKTMVPDSRMSEGQRSIFAPSPVRFRAALTALPSPQKTDYLQTALGLMQVSRPPAVSQSIVLDYGGDRPLRAYVEDGTAARLVKEMKVGETHTFYAFHVYNTHVGPALVVMSYGD